VTTLLPKRPDVETPHVSEDQAVKSVPPRSAWIIFLGIGVFLWLVRAILLPFVVAGAIAFACSPAVDWLAAKFSVRRWEAAVGIFLLLLVLSAVAGLIVGPIFVRDLVPMVSNLQATIDEAVHRFIGNGTVNILGQRMNAEQISQKAVAAFSDWLGQNGEIFSLAGAGVRAIFGVILQFVLLIYFLVGGPKIKAGLVWLIPPNQRPFARLILQTFEPMLRRYLLGIVAIFIFAAIAAYIGLGFALRLPHAGLLALMTGFLEIIPVVGPAASASIAGLAAIKTGNGIASIIGYAIYAIALRLSIDQVIGPLVLGHAARLHPSLIIFCFLAGGLLFGLPGLILAVPLALAIKVVLATAYAEPLK
jgi:predicted PurR-regulated permease PerM